MRGCGLPERKKRRKRERVKANWLAPILKTDTATVSGAFGKLHAR